MKAFFFVAFLSFQSFAKDCDVPGQPTPGTDLLPAMNAVTLLFWSVSPEQYENAACVTTEAIETDTYFTSLRGSVHRTVSGFPFENQPREMVKAFQDLFPRDDHRNSTCTTVLCAVDEIWGPQIGRKLLYLRMKHGYNGSEYAYPGSRRFFVSELDDILKVLNDLPPQFAMMGREGNQKMALAPEGQSYRRANGVLDPKVAADAGITLYDRWRNTPSTFHRHYEMYHEFGHNVSHKLGNLDKTDEYKALTSCHVSHYGDTDSAEDFAETFTMYRFNAQSLRSLCPAKYAYMKSRVYQGIEYLPGSPCPSQE